MHCKDSLESVQRVHKETEIKSTDDVPSANVPPINDVDIVHKKKTKKNSNNENQESTS